MSTDIVGEVIGIAMDVGTSGSKAGCLVGLIVAVLAVLVGVGLSALSSSTCETRCANYGTATFVGEKCLCRTAVGSYIDPLHPPGTPR